MANYEGFGSDLEKGNTTDYATSTSWTSVGCVVSITPPQAQIDTIEVPTCVNAATRAKSFLPGAYDPGTCQYTILFAPGDVQDGLDSLGVDGAWRIKLSDSGNYFRFNGFFTAVGMPEISENGFLQVNCEIKVTGEAEENTGS